MSITQIAPLSTTVNRYFNVEYNIISLLNLQNQKVQIQQKQNWICGRTTDISINIL